MLVANLAANEAMPIGVPRGDVIWGGGSRTGKLSPWTVLWSIEAQAKR
jgi:hypothetical protein